MAWYGTGTVTVTNNSTTVTGSGTEWIANVLPGEAFRGPNGDIIEIESVNSNTSLTLARNYIGSTLSAQAYFIIPIRGIDRINQALLAELITDYQSVVTGIGAGLIPDGTVSAPALRFSADQDTGVYRIGANTIGTATAGTYAGAVNGSQNWGFGETDIVSRVDVRGDIRVRSATGSQIYLGDTAFTGAFALRGPGIGAVVNPSDGVAGELGLYTYNGTDNRVLRFLVKTNGTMLGGKTASSLATQGVEINPIGLLAATSSADAAGYFNRLTSDGTLVLFARAGTQVGSISVTTTATAYNTSSDYRLKNIDGPLTGSGDFIDALNPVRGTWKAGGETFIGLIAHEVQEVCETPVATGEKDGEEMQALSYSSPEMQAHIIAELKSLRARVAALEAAS